MSEIRLVVKPGNYGNVVEVDGVDIANGCQAYSLISRVGDVPKLCVELAIMEDAAVAGEADVRVVMTESARLALIALGWSPPDE